MTKPAIRIEKRPAGWARQKDGTSRAGSVHRTQAEAEEAGRRQAKRERTELIVTGEDGQIKRRDSYGNDPFPPRG
jgi:hypothetical protein